MMGSVGGNSGHGHGAAFTKFEPGDRDPNSIELGLVGGREAAALHGRQTLLDDKDGHSGADSGGQSPSCSQEDVQLFWGYSASRGLPACTAPNWTVRPYIHWGYRDVLTVRQAVRSLFYCHNETGNVVTHLGGLLVFVGFFVRDLWFRELPLHHRAVVCMYLLAAQFCMGSSAAFHLMGPISKKGYEVALRCDMTGIALVIVASFMVGIHYGYWCHQTIGHIYIVIVGILSCIALAWPYIPALFHNFNASVIFFASFVVFALVPLFHWCYLVGGPTRCDSRQLLAHMCNDIM